MDKYRRDALIGFHSFTATDYTSAFFRKDKKEMLVRYVIR